MKIDIIALAVVAVALAAAATGCSWLLATYAPGLSPARLFLEADIIAKLVMLLLMLLPLPILVLGVFGVAVRSAATPMTIILRAAAAVSALLGLFAAAYGWMTIQTAVAKLGPAPIELLGPLYAEALLVLAWSLFVAALALALAVGIRLRAGARRKT